MSKTAPIVTDRTARGNRLQLENKRIIVTRGANGIAAATVRAYAREEARVAALDIVDEVGKRGVHDMLMETKSARKHHAS